jgi:hypothetical protein
MAFKIFLSKPVFSNVFIDDFIYGRINISKALKVKDYLQGDVKDTY